MKKFAFIVAAAALFAACSGNKQQNAENNEPAQAEESFQEQQIKAGMSARLDSLTECYMRVKPFAMFDKSKEGVVALTADEKKVAPDYLMNPDQIMNTLESLSLKYRALVVLDTDAQVAKLYEMPDVYTEPVAKLMGEVNDPAVKFFMENDGKMERSEMMKEIYKVEEEAGRANYFWEASATAIIEQLYIIGQNQEKFLASFTDKDAEDITWHLSILVDAYEDLAEYNLELRKLYNVLLPLEALNAITVDEFRSQLNGIKTQVEEARAALFL